MAESDIKEFDMDDTSDCLSKRWEAWVKNAEDKALDFTSDSLTRKEVLIKLAGDRIANLYETLKVVPADEDEYENFKQTIATYFQSPASTVHHCVLFGLATQHFKEPVRDYCARLRKLASGCCFLDEDHEILLRMICTCLSPGLKKQALWIPSLRLSSFLELAESREEYELDARKTLQKQLASSELPKKKAREILKSQKLEKERHSKPTKH